MTKILINSKTCWRSLWVLRTEQKAWVEDRPERWVCTERRRIWGERKRSVMEMLRQHPKLYLRQCSTSRCQPLLGQRSYFRFHCPRWCCRHWCCRRRGRGRPHRWSAQGRPPPSFKTCQTLHSWTILKFSLFITWLVWSNWDQSPETYEEVTTWTTGLA